MTSDEKPKLVNLETSLAAVAIVIASVAGVVLRDKTNNAALIACAASYLLVLTVGQFYALTFVQSSLKLSWQTSYLLMSIALASGDT